MASNLEAEINEGKVPAKASSLRKKKLCCKFCKKKFTSYQALGGHQNGHKDERAAAQKEKILSMAYGYNNDSFVDWFCNSNQTYGFSGKTLGVSPLSKTNLKSFYSKSSLNGFKHQYPHHIPWSRHHTLNSVQPSIYQLQNLITSGGGFHQHHKSYQPINFPISRGGVQNSESQQSLFNYSSHDIQNFDEGSNSPIRLTQHNPTIERPDLNLDLNISWDSDSLSTMPAKEVLDLTLKM